MVVPSVIVKGMRPEIPQGCQRAGAHLVSGQPATIGRDTKRAEAKPGSGGTADVVSRTGAIVFGPVHDDAGMLVRLLPKVTHTTFCVILQELALVQLERRSRLKGRS